MAKPDLTQTDLTSVLAVAMAILSGWLYLLRSSPRGLPLTGLYLLWLQAEGPFPYALVARAEAQCYFELPDEVAAFDASIWSHAAGSLLVTEAGGLVTDTAGNPLDPNPNPNPNHHAKPNPDPKPNPHPNPHTNPHPDPNPNPPPSPHPHPPPKPSP